MVNDVYIDRETVLLKVRQEDEMVDQYIRYLSKQVKRSPATIRGYKSDLGQFSNWLTEKGVTPTEVNIDMATEYIEYMNARQLKPATVQRMVASCKSFYRWLIRKKVVRENPFNELELPQISDRLPRFITVEEYERLVSFPRIDPIALRDKAILELLVSSAIRVGELSKLKLDNLDMSQCQIRFVGKRNKERIVPFGPRAARALGLYLSIRSRLTINGNTLFVNQYGQPFREGGIRLMMETLSRNRLGFTVSPHQLRHSCATWMLNGGAPLEGIAELLGHSSPIITKRVYAHMNTERVREIQAASHPLDRLPLEHRLVVIK